MSGPASWSWRRRGGAAAAAAVLLAVALPAAGEPPRANPRGGFLPAREQPSISGGETRDEIVRRHDLNSDGRIDEGEAEVARTRLRRQRLEILRNSGADPITGRLRSAADEEARGPQADDYDLLLVPGSDAEEQPKPAPRPKPKPEPRPAATVPPGRTPLMTGGVRAGAPAVRPGYGAPGPARDLNAGRPRETQPQRQRMPSAAPPRPGPAPPTAANPTAEDFGR